MVMMADVNIGEVFSLPRKWKGAVKKSWGNMCGSLIDVCKIDHID